MKSELFTLKFSLQSIFVIFLCSLLMMNFGMAQNFNNSQLVTKISEIQNGLPDTFDYTASNIDKLKHLIVAGNTKSSTTDMLLTKYALSGGIDWVHTYNNSYGSVDYGTAVATDDSDNIYVAGTSVTSSINGYDYLIRKY